MQEKDKRTIDRLLEEYFDGGTDPQLDEVVQGWLISAKNSREKAEALGRIFEQRVYCSDADRSTLKALEEMHRRLGFIDPKAVRRRVRPLRSRIMFRVAAVMIPALVVVGALFVWNEFRQNPGKGVQIAAQTTTVTVPGGEHMNLVLDDGTEVTLNENSVLTYGDRNAYLEGEGFFKVKKSEKPFILDSRDMQVTVLGTEFNVSAYPESGNASVSLYEGRVRVDSRDRSFTLSPHERFSVNTVSGEMRLSKMDGAESSPRWMSQGQANAMQTATMPEIFRTIEAAYDVKIDYDMNIGRGRRFVMPLPGDENIDEVMNTLMLMSGDFTYTRNEDTITVTGVR